MLVLITISVQFIFAIQMTASHILALAHAMTADNKFNEALEVSPHEKRTSYFNML